MSSSLLKILRRAARRTSASSISVNENNELEPQKRSDSSSNTVCTYATDFENNVGQKDNEVKRKSVSFNERIDVFLIPTREEMAALIKSRTVENMILNIKRVHFNKVVNVFPIPSRKNLTCIAGDLWYSKDDITRMENDLFGTLS